MDESAGQRSRRETLDAAARILRSNGYRATTLRDIAAAVGIKAGTIYYHFAPKDDIVAAVMNDGVDHVFGAVTRALSELPASAGARKRLEATIRAHLHALPEYGDYTSAGLKASATYPRPHAGQPARLGAATRRSGRD